MLQLIPLEKIERLESLETALKPLNERDRRKHYSNLELICNSMNLIYQSHLKLELISQKRNDETLTAEEYQKLSIEANQQTKKAHVYLSTYEKDCIYWNDEDIEKEFKSMIFGNVEEC